MILDPYDLTKICGLNFTRQNGSSSGWQNSCNDFGSLWPYYNPLSKILSNRKALLHAGVLVAMNLSPYELTIALSEIPPLYTEWFFPLDHGTLVLWYWYDMFSKSNLFINKYNLFEEIYFKLSIFMSYTSTTYIKEI